MNCRHCQTELNTVFADLHFSPPSNSFLLENQLNSTENYFPLKVYACPNCFLVQVDEYKNAKEIFDQEYVYFSSFSTSWLAHCKSYTEQMIERFGFGESDQVVEIASNDGYLLQYFKEQGLPVLGIEPTANTAAVAQEKGIKTLVEYFGTDTAGAIAQREGKASLLLGNNVLAHVPDINDFVQGMKLMLAENGVITMEFPHLLQLIEESQFDTIYHEHFSYLSFIAVEKIFASVGITLFDVEEIPTHGGSLRIFGKHEDDVSHEVTNRVKNLVSKEKNAGLNSISTYKNFQEKCDKIKLDFTEFLIQQKKSGKKVAGYGAAAKGNTLLNFCGIKKDLIDYVVDKSPHKQNKYLPGAHIPVVHEDHLKENKPDYVIIFPWNIKTEIMDQLQYIKDWGGQFVIAIPELTVE